MKHPCTRFLLLIVLGTLTPLIFAQSPDLASVYSGFKDPPANCRIMMRWWWFGAGVNKPELERELSAMKAAGIGGVEVQPVYPLALDDPEQGFRNFPYLSDEFIDALGFAAVKARELGLRFDLTLGSGWPFGGAQVPVTQAAGKLRFVSVSILPQASSIPVPDISTGERLLAVFLSSEGTATLRNPSEIHDGRLFLPANRNRPGTILWFIGSRTGMMVKRPAVGAEGFVLDHFDRAAADNYLHIVGDRLMQAFGGRPPYAIFSDSLEVYGSDWTKDLLEQFQRRRGYDLTPYLPALVQDAGPKTPDIRYDWGRTLTELINEHYLTPLREWAAQHGTRFRSQTYGIPAVSLSSNALVDLPEGEGNQWRSFSTSRWAASASHLFERSVTSAETWTWLHSAPFRATPLDMKAQADIFFLQGINLLIGHGWPYSPPFAGEPGWRFYAAGAFNDHNPWWPVMPELARYLQRVSYTLQLGQPVNDVAVLLPTEDAWSQFKVGQDSVSESMDRLLGPEVIPQILNAGFNFDFIDSEAIESQGIRHKMLVLPAIERIPLATYRKIEDYVQGGGIVIASRTLPFLAPGLREGEPDTPTIREISERLFRASAAKGHFVSDEHELGTTLARNSKPDVTINPPTPELGFVHRKLPLADIYFLVNTSNRPIHTTATFRAQAGQARWWDPFSGTTSEIRDSSIIELNLEPYESRLVALSNQAIVPTIPGKNKKQTTQRTEEKSIDLGTEWTVNFPSLNRIIHMNKLHSWSEDEETRFYSGEAIYRKEISISKTFLKRGTRVYLDFGPGTVVERQPSEKTIRAWLESPVREAAQVFVNDRLAGAVWKPPYKIEITGMLNIGTNQIRIVVENTAINRLAGQSLPDYRLLNSRYGQRFVAQGMDNLQPLPSGLLGPVRLIEEEARQ